MRKFNLRLFGIIALFIAFVPVSIFSADKLPTEKAGTINPATGQLAFSRNGDIWIMNVDGTNQKKITTAGNSDGLISWSPDNKTLMFTRSGMVDLKGPDFLGGKHKLYDLFHCYIDSAANDNTMFWLRITDDLGNRDPQWLSDNKIVFWKDMNANTVNAFSPNYQILTMEPDGSNIEILRKDWQTFYEEFLSSPSMNKNGEIACVYFEKQRQVGLVVIPAGKIMMSMDSIKVQANKYKSMVAPSWSPDAKWIAAISNDMNDGGLFIFSADLKEKYLVAAPPVGTDMMTMAPSFSPDSKWLTFATHDGSVWICDITGNGLKRLTGPGPDKGPAWSK